MRDALAVTAILLAPALTLANGGPVGWGGEGPVGGVHPVQDVDVRLVSEDLRLVLLPDGKRYRAEARYVLANPSAAKSVEFGVPVFLPTEDVAEGEPRQIGEKELAAVSKRIRIDVAGQSAGCKVVLAPALASVPAGRETGRADGGPSAEAKPNALCVAHVRVPKGAAVPLSLTYDGELAFTDMEYSKSALIEYDRRTLRWVLSPAGYWAGRPDRVTIRLEPGPFDGLVSAVPAPTRKEGAVLVWSMERPDLKATPDLVVTVDAEPILRHVELATSRTESFMHEGARLVATASSTLAPQGKSAYGAERAVDRDATTAWCAGKRGGAAGEWIEVRVTFPKGAEPGGYCRLEGYALIPGYARTQKTWAANNRLRAFRIGPCGSASGGKVIELAPGADPLSRGEYRTALRLSDHADRSGLLVQEAVEDASCIRLTIEGVVRGAADDDTCISEFRPVFNCG